MPNSIKSTSAPRATTSERTTLTTNSIKVANNIRKVISIYLTYEVIAKPSGFAGKAGILPAFSTLAALVRGAPRGFAITSYYYDFLSGFNLQAAYSVCITFNRLWKLPASWYFRPDNHAGFINCFRAGAAPMSEIITARARWFTAG
jgi:hypothetical protein